jgi:sigma-B regulation protein RsbU (phosphoserine phosphatase)
MLLRKGAISHLETGGMVLGVDPETTFDRDPLALQSGDVLLLYTDGVVDALNFSDEPFGLARLTSSFTRHADQPAEMLVKSLLWDLRRFRGLADRVDDVTIVALKIK